LVIRDGWFAIEWRGVRMLQQLRRKLIALLRKQEWYYSHLSCILMHRLGRAPGPLHPKHLYAPEEPWYEEHIYPGCDFLDVGSGVGTACIRAREKHARLAVGVDYDAGNIELARERARSGGLDGSTHFIQLNIEHSPLPFPSGHFDVVLFSNVIEHLHRRIDVLREIRRVLRPTGHLLLSAPNGYTPWKNVLRRAGISPYDDEDHKIEYSREELVEELRQGGFHIKGDWIPATLSTPLKGVIDLSAAISPRLYRRLSLWKRRHALRHPESAIGWRLVAYPDSTCGVTDENESHLASRHGRPETLVAAQESLADSGERCPPGQRIEGLRSIRGDSTLR